MDSVEAAYRKVAAASATGLGLLIALYDKLIGHLRRAAEAERRNDVEQRCHEAKNGLLVIAALEHWLDEGSGGELADRLKVFYTTMRRKIIEAQAKRSPAMLEEQMALALEVRAQWQKVNDKSAPSEPFILPPVAMKRLGPYSPRFEERHQNWSA